MDANKRGLFDRNDVRAPGSNFIGQALQAHRRFRGGNLVINAGNGRNEVGDVLRRSRVEGQHTFRAATDVEIDCHGFKTAVAARLCGSRLFARERYSHDGYETLPPGAAEH